MNKIYYEFLEKLISKSRKEKIDKVLSRRTRYIEVLLENIYQSHNLSAVIRTCDNLGIQDIYTIKSEKIKNSGKNVSLGAEKWVSIKSKNKDEKLFDYLNKIKKNGYKIVGTSTVKNNISCDITDLKLDEKLIFAFGNEEKGLSKDFIKQCDHIVSIPMYGFAQSYNISVSCAIVLSNIIFKIRKSKKSIFLSKNEKEEIRNEWIKNSIKNSNLILKNIEKKRAWKDSNPRPPEP